jgi:hypothetical protein
MEEPPPNPIRPSQSASRRGNVPGQGVPQPRQEAAGGDTAVRDDQGPAQAEPGELFRQEPQGTEFELDPGQVGNGCHGTAPEILSVLVGH